jgi:hypothetical protein
MSTIKVSSFLPLVLTHTIFPVSSVDVCYILNDQSSLALHATNIQVITLLIDIKIMLLIDIKKKWTKKYE